MKDGVQRQEKISLAEYAPLIEKVLASGGRFQLYPYGVSMLPVIRQGRDFVYLERLACSPQRDDILLYRRKNGSFVLHRVAAVAADGSCTMLGDNQSVPEPGVLPCQLIGIVTGVGHNGAEPEPDSTGSAAYLFFWCRCLWLRKIVLFCRALPGRVKRRINKLMENKA